MVDVVAKLPRQTLTLYLAQQFAHSAPRRRPSRRTRSVSRCRAHDATYVRALDTVPCPLTVDLADTEVNQLHENDGSAKANDGYMEPSKCVRADPPPSAPNVAARTSPFRRS